MSRPLTGRPANTLPELLVVAGVLGVLAGLTLGAVQKVRGTAARLACGNNLRQIGLGLHHHHDARGAFPPAVRKARTAATAAHSGVYAAVPWPVLLLPYIDQEPLHRQATEAYWQDRTGYRVPPHTGLATVVPTYVCPADGRTASPLTGPAGFTAAYMGYAGVAGDGKLPGVLRYWRGTRLAAVTDGASSTLLAGDRPPGGEYLVDAWYTVGYADSVWQYDGYARGPTLSVRYDAGRAGCQGAVRYGPGQVGNRCDTWHFWSLHGGGGNFLFADGGVRFLPYSAADLLPAMATRAGGEVVADP